MSDGQFISVFSVLECTIALKINKRFSRVPLENSAACLFVAELPVENDLITEERLAVGQGELKPSSFLFGDWVGKWVLATE